MASTLKPLEEGLTNLLEQTREIYSGCSDDFACELLKGILDSVLRERSLRIPEPRMRVLPGESKERLHSIR